MGRIGLAPEPARGCGRQHGACYGAVSRPCLQAPQVKQRIVFILVVGLAAVGTTQAIGWGLDLADTHHGALHRALPEVDR